MKKGLIIAGTIIALAGCYNDSYDKLYPVPVTKGTTNTCDTTTISYANEILPILNTNCNSSACHGAGGGTSGYDFTDTTVLHSTNVVSNIINDINFTPSGRGHNSMPFGGSQISSCDINKITRWVHLGSNCSN